MTDQDQTAQEERAQVDAVAALNIGSLRKAAKLLGITAQRDWSKEDFVAAIQAKQEENTHQLVFDSSTAPRPGFARVLIHRDPTPGHRNTPIHVGVNGWIFQIPRGIEVDVPIPIVEVLKNARSIQVRQREAANAQNPSGTYQDEEQTNYPFQLLQMTPGEFKNSNDGRGARYERKYAFFKKFERWPTDGELNEAMKQQIIKEMKE